jgi:translocator protein
VVRRNRPFSHPAASALTLVVFLVLLTAIAAFEGFVASSSASDWFSSSEQVVWTAPRSIARPVWSGVFVLLALVGWRVWRSRRSTNGAVHDGVARASYVVVLALVTVWPAVYLDGYQVLGVAALWIAFVLAFLLVAVLAVLAISAWRSTRAGSLLVGPVFLWILYIATVNLGDAVLASLE